MERESRTVRDDWLGQHLFENIEEVRDYATKWLWTYDNERPNMDIGGITPDRRGFRAFLPQRLDKGNIFFDRLEQYNSRQSG